MKRKLNLSTLKIKSFVTTLQENQTEIIKGGDVTDSPSCIQTSPACCDDTSPAGGCCSTDTSGDNMQICTSNAEGSAPPQCPSVPTA